MSTGETLIVVGLTIWIICKILEFITFLIKEKKMATFRIGSNSVNITGRSIKIVDGDIFVDGNNITSMVQVPENRILEVRIVEGVLDNLDSSANVVCGEVRGNVDASGNVTCGNVGGSIDAGGNVVCGNVEGNLDAGGNVTAQNIKGSVDAGGNIRIIG